SGLSVTFTPPVNGASGSFSGNPTVTTNASGVAAAPTFTANATAGSYTVQAVSGALSTSFSLTNSLNIPAGIKVFSGTGQVAQPGAVFGGPLVALVFNPANQPVPNVT